MYRPSEAESARLPELGMSACSTPVHVQAEIKDIVKIGYLNGLFVLARSIGLAGLILSMDKAGHHFMNLYHKQSLGRVRTLSLGLLYEAFQAVSTTIGIRMGL